MKTLLLSVALAATATAAFADGELTCWYNDQGQSAGADSGNYLNAPLFQSVQNTRGGGGGPWVYVLGAGEWSDGNSCPESIDVSGTVSASPAGTTPNYALPPTYGSVDLAAGFMPDPYEVGVYAGGTIASDGVLAGCYAGWIAEAPDFRLNFTAGTNPRISIQDNILFGKLAYGHAFAQQKINSLIADVVASLALRDDIIESGLGYEVGVAGGRLSSIQRQKLGLARTLLKAPDLLIVNESLSALDTASERRLIENIRKMMASRGILWILGRVQLAEQFDSIMVMEQGKLLDQGSFETLQTTNQHFQHLLTSE